MMTTAEATMTATSAPAAAGFILKDARGEDIVRATISVAEGGSWLDPQIAGRVLETYRRIAAPQTRDRDRLAQLIQRALDVLRQLGHGATNAEIAAALFVSEATVKSHLGNLLTKLDLRDRAAAIAFAHTHGLARDLDEAATVDGATPYRAFWDIVLPLARPALGATVIISFLTAWNEYEFALVLTSSERVRTISVAIASLIGEFTTEWNQVMAAAAVGTIPVIIIFIFFQRQLMQGMMGGAIKG
jgi:DNA-binding CsgD family transcriptional regulator